MPETRVDERWSHNLRGCRRCVELHCLAEKAARGGETESIEGVQMGQGAARDIRTLLREEMLAQPVGVGLRTEGGGGTQQACETTLRPRPSSQTTRRRAACRTSHAGERSLRVVPLGRLWPYALAREIMIFSYSERCHLELSLARSRLDRALFCCPITRSCPAMPIPWDSGCICCLLLLWRLFAATRGTEHSDFCAWSCVRDVPIRVSACCVSVCVCVCPLHIDASIAE